MRKSVDWSHQIRAESEFRRGAGMASALSWLLRKTADRIDKGQSVRLEYSTTPRIDPHVAAKCVERGVSHAGTLLESMAQQEACDQALHETHPELFREGES